MEELTRREFNQIKGTIANRLDILIEKYGRKTIEDIKRILNSNRKRAFGNLINRIRWERLDSRFVIIMEQYADFVDRGTKTYQAKPTPFLGVKYDGSGKVRYTPMSERSFFSFLPSKPTQLDPMSGKLRDNIQKWIDKKGIVERKKGFIARSIWRWGIKPTPFTFKITENNKKLQQEIAKTASLFVKIKMKTK